jgi:ATP-binding cassette subfamily B protein
LKSFIVSVGLMGLALLANEVMGSVYEYAKTALADRVQDAMYESIHVKVTSLDLQFFESPVYYDQLQRASVDAVERSPALLESLGSLMQNAISLIAMAGVLTSFAWWLPLALFAGTLPALYVALRTTWRFHRWRVANTVNQRRLSYYHHALTSDLMAAEIRLFNLGAHFRAAYRELRRKLRTERLGLSKSQLAAQIGASLTGLVSMALTLAWMAWQAMRGLFNLGDMAMLYQAMNVGQRLMRNLLTGIASIYRNLLFLDDLFVFLDIDPILKDPETPVSMPAGLRRGLRLENLSFRYPESERVALADFCLDIPAGRIVAIVGENGAGKSTLLKLICRFYDPQGGCITWDGCDIRDMAQADLRRRITVLFQQPATYHETAADNIAFGDIDCRHDRAKIEAAARAASADAIIESLPEGYATVLGKWFGYTELSVGEWQRLALARAFVRKADLVIFDEPTSAMDSWTESGWLERFRELVADRTAIIITHRFTTAMRADIIHVMDEGRIVESGTHAELVALEGKYASSWRMQMRETVSHQPEGNAAS